ncbi:helix-turn-helix transcriptional regulator [Luteimonas sp. SJ-92]|uniref:Helix-turn-helix transcriptional regulator n=1 Tax=Luteimonas salinisoli TaxID=2752307 RepID=A0A853JAZ0_9GAMM|nr:helix-turn-helix domain-containing protein [Luteimonas salinisoli]NZA26406.1 helix-turn-helix transcriptional regulator [Luteimonas salinisoli]
MTKIPVPGTPVRGSKSGSAIMALFDLLGRRWAMGVLWTLSERGPSTFGELEAACESISPAVLNTRLKELAMAGLVAKGAHGYTATGLGREIYRGLLPLSATSKKWARQVETRLKADK